MRKCLLAFAFMIVFTKALAVPPDWSEGHIVPVNGRANPYELDAIDWLAANTAGRLHAQIYPVEITGSLPPYQPIRNLIEDQNQNLFRHWISKFVRGVSKINSFDDLAAGLGLHPYPLETDTGVYAVPYPEGKRPDSRLGMGLIERHGAQGFTFSCAACHSSRLFGKTVLGMSNRFPRANDFFIQAKAGVQMMSSFFFKNISHATSDETALYKSTKNNIQFVGLKSPLALGLDTSLAQVALSLDRRGLDGWAEKTSQALRNPRPDWLQDHPADSKPAVWWNLKYKNRWLSDGSILSGNPIMTNILWNEIGRGVDLHELSLWMKRNAKIIQELTTAVFSSEAPLFTDFFPAESINLQQAQAGEKIFEKTCSRCHGHYEKKWTTLPAQTPLIEKLKTAKVIYPQPTRVIDVGTDSHRRQGMQSLEKLNNLQISKEMGVVVKAQNGYVPPPLVGIWARWPYFHNNSAPSLCAVLTPGPLRPSVYWARAAENSQTDFEATCNGYPLELRDDQKEDRYKYDTRREGLGNQGHDERIFIKDGKEILSTEQKQQLILFLQTL